MEVHFTIGFLDDDNNYVGNASAYPPVFLQYRQQKCGAWMPKWNTSEIESNYRLINCLF